MHQSDSRELLRFSQVDHQPHGSVAAPMRYPRRWTSTWTALMVCYPRGGHQLVAVPATVGIVILLHNNSFPLIQGSDTGIL